MKNVTLQSICLLAGVILSVGCTRNKEQAIIAHTEQDKVAIEQLIDKYVKTINQCDTALVNCIWSHDEKVSFIAPTGYYSSHNEIRDSLVVGVFGTFFSERHLRKDSLKIEVNGNSAWSEFAWTFDATRKDGTAHHAKGRETQIFKKYSNGRWKLIHIHYSAIE